MDGFESDQGTGGGGGGGHSPRHSLSGGCSAARGSLNFSTSPRPPQSPMDFDGAFSILLFSICNLRYALRAI